MTLNPLAGDFGWTSRDALNAGCRYGGFSVRPSLQFRLPGLVGALSDSLEAFIKTEKGSRREVAVILNHVPAGLDAAHVGVVFADVMRSGHCGARTLVGYLTSRTWMVCLRAVAWSRRGNGIGCEAPDWSSFQSGGMAVEDACLGDILFQSRCYFRGVLLARKTSREARAFSRAISSSVSRSSSRIGCGILRLRGMLNTALVAPAMVLVEGRRAGTSGYGVFGIRARPRRGCWASPIRRSFPSPTSFHLSRTRCGPSIRRRHPGGAAHRWGRRCCETLCFS